MLLWELRAVESLDDQETNVAARPLTKAESELVRHLLVHHSPRSAEREGIDLSTVLVSRYDESECLRFVRPASSAARSSSSDTHSFDDHGGVKITASPRATSAQARSWRVIR